ncbi:hypothetical protein ABZ595_28825 [Streptomyces rubradiris]|uniref:hypothetical protein n=1 Tax=Streptomyces rubradiris TaxID=285531 RepID=UPI0033D261CE
MILRTYEVDVPIHDPAHPDRRGLHVFTGAADSPAAALGQPDTWTARGLRPGWELEWTAATAGLWHNPVSWSSGGDVAL